ncbi:MAG TPA: transcriptional regulator NrdR [Candidatus Saccharimonadales bacterium]|nr:transcriptional regulator NrdR [Candidatus Saccharimonadales bacterium]
MKCPKCQHPDSKVIESREAGDGDSIRRRRECLNCHCRYTSYERVERPNLAVVKKNGDRELFDRNKLFGAIMVSVGKFLRSDVEVEQIVAKVEDELYALGTPEVTSAQIGDKVLEELGSHNGVAYVRFASVYQNFSSLEGFERAIKQARELSSKE